MRWSLCWPSYKLELAIWSLRRARTRTISSSLCLKSGHLYHAATGLTTDSSSAISSKIHDLPIRGVEQKDTLVQRTWQTQLTTFKQLEYESDLDSYSRNGYRLVDHDKVCCHHGLWLELLLYRRRVFGVKGMIPVWLSIMKKDVLLAKHSSVSTIWPLLLELGFYDHLILHQICAHAEHIYVSTGYRYPDLYVSIIRHFVNKDSWLMDRWHERLRDMFPPTAEQYCELFAYLHRPGTRIKFTKFMQMAYKELSLQGIYSNIVSFLCKAKLFQAALEWHNFLVEHKDFPATSKPTDPLFEYLSLSKNSRQASKITKDLLDAGVQFILKSSHQIDKDEMLTKEAMNLLHGKHYGIAPKELSDDFCARLFATRFFSIEHTIKGLEILGTQAVGPKSLRELMVRTLNDGKMDSQFVLGVLLQLSAAGISIGRSVFARVVKELATYKEVDILHNIVTCDMHFEAFEDRDLQESLLHHYCKTGDKRGIQRTLAILLVDTRDDPSRRCRSWNYLLRSAVNNLDWKEISKVLESMVNLEIEVTVRSCKYMLQRISSIRQVGRRPRTTANDLDPLINIWQSIMRRGGTIPVSLWSEVLHRLGMNGFLHEFEKLALWLTAWFTEPSFRHSQMSVAAISKLMKESANFTSPVTMYTVLRKDDLRHPLRQLFPSATIQAIVAWGFQHESSKHPGIQFVDREHADANSSPNARWTWGLRLLCRLQSLGLRFSPIVLGKACEIRLIGIFGKGMSKRPRNRTVQARHSGGHLEQYLSSMEEIVGEGLFRGLYPQTFRLDKRSRRQAISRLIAMKAEYLTKKNTNMVIRPWQPKGGPIMANKFP